MKKKTIITAMLALIAMMGLAQTQTATITGEVPAVKDGTVIGLATGSIGKDVGTVQNGRFSVSVPVEDVTLVNLDFFGEGCPVYSFYVIVSPGSNVKVSGSDCLYPLWKVESPVPEQQTRNRIVEHCRDLMEKMLHLELSHANDKIEPVRLEIMKRELDILPSLPVDIASIETLYEISIMAKVTKDFPYLEQARALEKRFAARAPQALKTKMDEIHANLYPPRLLQVGDQAVDYELFDLQGNKHHLSDAFAGGRYVLLDFWGIGCGPCRMAEAEMNDFYEKIKDKLEIVGISADDFSQWKEHEFSKRIAWKNWNDGLKGLNIVSSYCDVHAMPYYVLLSPDKHIVWKAMGYVPGYFMGMYDALNGLPQDNTSNLALVVTKVDVDAYATKVSFRYYTLKEYPFVVARQSYLAANGKRYKVTAADGITLDERTFVNVKAHTATEGILANIYYSDFTLTFEPFDTKPATFDFREGDGEDVFVIRNISL